MVKAIVELFVLVLFLEVFALTPANCVVNMAPVSNQSEIDPPCTRLLTAVEFSTTIRKVPILVAVDEEWREKDSLLLFLIEKLSEAAGRFRKEFDIFISRFMTYEWDSDDAKDLEDDLIAEAVVESGFNLRRGKDVSILIAFTGQNIFGIDPITGEKIDIIGAASRSNAAVIVEYMGDTSWEDELIQHEISHLYDAPCHDSHVDNCVMCQVHTFCSSDWCNDCKSAIFTVRERYGWEKLIIKIIKVGK